MAEAVSGLGEAGHLLKQPRPGELGYGRTESACGGLFCLVDGSEQGEAELGPEHRGGADDFLARWAEPVHTGTDEAFQYLGNLRSERPGELPPALLTLDGSGFDERKEPLLQEEGVALHARANGVQDICGGVSAHEGDGKLQFGPFGEGGELD